MPERRVTTPRKTQRTSTGRISRDLRLAIGSEVRRLRLDTGLSQRRLAEIAGIDHGFMSQIERGLREPSLAVLVAVATALGGSLNVKLYPGTGPRLTDSIQARIAEALIRIMDPRWTRMVEVPVYRPASGVIDLVVDDRAAAIVVATEIQSEIRRLEQQLRWSKQKADALPSAHFWRFVEDDPRIERLLVLRSTRANRELASRFDETLRTAYPAASVDAVRALTTPDGPWPGSAVLWARVEGDAATILERPPRGVAPDDEHDHRARTRPPSDGPGRGAERHMQGATWPYR